MQNKTLHTFERVQTMSALASVQYCFITMEIFSCFLADLEVSAGHRSLIGKILQFDRQISSLGGHA
jgi:hypothetical protein